MLYVLLFIELKIPNLGNQLSTINYIKEFISYFINPLEGKLSLADFYFDETDLQRQIWKGNIKFFSGLFTRETCLNIC